ncbi:MAG: CBS domain-containing protein [Clostridiales bacterium]|nr:CBS domain-containing protein [Clostridiales bacterium]
MNIMFFLTPKSEVAYIDAEDSLRQVMEKMEYHRYSAVPIVGNNGDYFGAITEGDILWFCKEQKDMNLVDAEEIPLIKIPRHVDYRPVSADSNMEDLINLSMNQNFVPVVDDMGKFIGIITRKDIIQYLYNAKHAPLPSKSLKN